MSESSRFRNMRTKNHGLAHRRLHQAVRLDDSLSLDALSELSRHYDSTLWAVTSFWAALIGGLLIYNFNCETFNEYLSVFGMLLNACALFFAASFRKINAEVQSRMPSSMRTLFRSPAGFGQWNLLFFLFSCINILWAYVLFKFSIMHYWYWILLVSFTGSFICYYWYAAKGKGRNEEE